MSLRDYEEFVYRAGKSAPARSGQALEEVAKEQLRLVKILNRVDKLHFRGSNVDLKMRVKGRKWISCHGTENFPDGEISPVRSRTLRKGSSSLPIRRNTMAALQKTSGLNSKAGEWSRKAPRAIWISSRPCSTPTKVRARGRGDRHRTNYQIQRSTGNTLFDEKIGGTCHMAVGASILESGGKNHSAHPLDMVCDLKKDGEIVADGK